MPLKKNQQIVDLEYIPAEQVPENPAKKNSIVDVLCRDNYGRQFIVEMQMLWTNYFTKRMVFNASKAYVRQLNKGDHYHLLQPVYGLAILNEPFDKETGEFYHHYRIINDRNTEEVIEGLEFVMIELTKFEAEKWADRRMAVLWLRFLKEIEEDMKDVPEEFRENDYIRRALNICEEGGFTEAERIAYEKFWDNVSVEKSLLYESTYSREKGREDGREEGEAKGRAEGIAEGEAKGRAEGIAEGEAKGLINVVLNCNRNGLSVEQIQALTGLVEERILEILRSNNASGRDE
jgi:predicted transposase/invertase (TIGR01784 family)